MFIFDVVDMVREGLGKSMAEMERSRMSSGQPVQIPPPHMYRPPGPHPNQQIQDAHR